MAKPFDPRRILKQIDNSLLRQFFDDHGPLQVLWDQLTEHRVEPIYEAWQALPDDKRSEIQGLMQDICALADHRGLAVLAEEVRWRCPGRIAELEAQRSKASAAMWVRINVPGAFSEAAMFARADALAAGRYWVKRNGLPKRAITPDDAMCSALASELTAYYAPAQMRGHCCKVFPYVRFGGAVYFFAYLDDFQEAHMVFDGDTDQPVLRCSRDAFENVFVFNPADGTMELFAQGGRTVQAPLQAAFARAVLGVEVAPADPLRPSYRLDHLLAHNFPLVSDPADGIEEAKLVRLRIALVGSGGFIEIQADPRGARGEIYSMMDRRLRPEQFAAGGARVLQATFALRFAHSGRGKQPRMTISVTAPDSSDLRQKHEPYRSAGERFLRLSGVIQ